MGLRAIAVVLLTLGVSAAAAQTPPAAPSPAPLTPATVPPLPPAPTVMNPIPPAPAVANGPAPLPKIVQPKPTRRATRRPRGEPIVRGNTDIYVDSYGQLSTTMQP